MDIRDVIIALSEDLIDTSKDVCDISKAIRKNDEKYVSLCRDFKTLVILSALGMIFTHMRIKKQEKVIENLNEQITELKNTKGD